MKLQLMNRFAIGVVAAGLLQTLAVASIVWDRAHTLATGTEVVLQTNFIDPRDLFRGHYVVLNLAISRVGGADVEVIGEPAVGDSVFVTLEKGEDAFWIVSSVSTELSGKGLAVLEGTLTRAPQTEQGTYGISFPFDRYFAPKLRAQRLERLRRQGRLGVIVALDGQGGGVVRGITIDGELIYDEPLW